MGKFHRHNHTIEIFKNPSTGIQYPTEGCLIPYNWQKEARNVLTDAKLGICNVPTGAGKTPLLYMMAIEYLIANPNNKVIFLVPQIMIEKEFQDKQIETNVGIYSIYPSKGIDNVSENSRKDAIETFLLRKIVNHSQDFSDRAYVCCYKTLVNLFDDLKVDNSIFDNTFIIIDEGHHIQNSENELGLVDSNRLGEIVSTFHKNSTIKILAATATLFRGDNKEILPKSTITDAIRYNMTLQKMLSDSDICPNLKSISMEYILSAVELSKIAKNINENPKKTGWWIPNVLTNESAGKIEDVKSVLKSFGTRITKNAALLLKYGISEEEISDGYGIVEYYRSKNGHIHKVIDLALDDDNKLFPEWKNRTFREDYLQKIQNEKKDKKYHWITDVIALNKMKEGTNWKPMERIVIVGYRKSLVDQIQIIGRGFRDWAGKELVEVIHIIPWNLANLDEETTIDNVRNHLKCICGIFVLEDSITPFYMNMPKLEKEQIERMERQKNIIERVFEGNENRVNEFYNNVSFDLYRECSGKTVREAKELLKGIVEKNLDNIGIDAGEKLEDVVEYVYRKLAVMKMKLERIDVKGIDFDFIENYDITDGWWQLFSKNIGVDILKAFEEKYRESLLDKVLEMKQWDTTKYKKWLKDNTNIELCEGEVFITVKDKLKHRCLECSHEWHREPDGIIRGSGCSMCNGGVKLNNEVYDKKLFIVNPNLKRIGEYIRNNQPLEHLCNICNTTFYPYPRQVLTKRQECPTCNDYKTKYTNDTYDKKLKEVNPTVIRIGNFIDTMTELKHQCLICSSFWDPRPGAVIRARSRLGSGNGCGVCANNIKRTTEEFIKKATTVHKVFYSYPRTIYINANTDVIITCPKHGDFSQKARKHLAGAKCRKCMGYDLTREEIIEILNERHGDVYGYEKLVIPKHKNGSIIITCRKHGDKEVNYSAHYYQGGGCPDCGSEKRWEKRNRSICDKEKHKLLCKQNNITTTAQYCRHYKNNRKEMIDLGILSTPWNSFGMTKKQWTSYINEK